MGGKIDIQIKHRERVLLVRRMDRLIQSDDFAYIWNRITDKEKQTIKFTINLMHHDILKRWMQKQLDLGYESYSIRDLRMLASKHHVRYYSRKTRAVLIKVLTEKGVLNGNTGGSFDSNETIPSHCGCKKGSN